MPGLFLNLRKNMQNNLRLAEYCEPLYCKIGRRWAYVKGYENFYQVSDDGLVRSFGRYTSTCYTKVYICGQILTPAKSSGRTMGVTLYGYDRKRRRYQVSQLVATHFIPNPNSYECVVHLDKNTDNNCVENLKWVSRSQASKYATSQKGEKRYCAKLSDQIVSLARGEYSEGKSIADLANLYKVNHSTMKNAITKKTWKHIN